VQYIASPGFDAPQREHFTFSVAPDAVEALPLLTG
jgi:hypothetical protein